jgi:hypothetical protein
MVIEYSEARRVADLLPEADAMADWRRVVRLYRQIVEFGGSEPAPPLLRGALAQAMHDVSASYLGQEEHMCAHGLAMLANDEGHERFDTALWTSYYLDVRFAVRRAVRPLPTPYESLVETSRRLRDARALRSTLHDTGTTGLLAGSISYGRFYNVRGHRPDAQASDLDLFVVLPDSGSLDDVVDRLGSVPFASRAAVDKLGARSRIFADRFDDGRTILSHKVECWDDRSDPALPGGAVQGIYLLSVHLITRPVLDYLLVDSTPRIRREVAGTRRSIRDYRDRTTRRRDLHRTFAGRACALDSDSVAVPGGHMRTTDFYRIDEHDFYSPGLYQSMLLPAPDLLWGDEPGALPRLRRFHRKLDERVRYEATVHRYALLRPSLAHVRRDAFAPWVIERIDAGLVS